MLLEQKDALGRDLGEHHILLTDVDFERRLKVFDPSLRLVFNKTRERWAILEPRTDGFYQILMVLEDRNGNAKPPGEWVLNKLMVWRHNYEVMRGNTERFWKDWDYYARKRDEIEDEKVNQETRYRIVDDINVWRRAIRKSQNLPTSDVTAGYRKF